NRDRGSLVLMSQDGKTPIHLKPGNSWIEIVRCCDMNGVDVSDVLADVQSTATFAALTATAKGPRLPADKATQTAAVAAQTNAVSAATAGINLNATSTPTAGTPGMPTGTPISVGLNWP